MMKKNNWFFLLFALFVIVGCKPSVPSEYLQPDEMEDILYDYHMAEAMARLSTGNRPVNEMAYKYAVFEKYGITEAQFDSSLVYYMRHTERLHVIYTNLSERISKESEAMGASSGNTLTNYVSANGDTADIWNRSRAFVLSKKAPFNVFSYTVKADTSFRKGDGFELRFNSQFIMQDGIREGTAVLALRFTNDSVASMKASVYGSQPNVLRLDAPIDQAVKEVKGFFLFNKNSSDQESETTLKLMIIKDISLVWTRKRKEEWKLQPDSLKIDTIMPPIKQ